MPPPPALSRRAAVGGLLAVPAALAAACTAGTPPPGSRRGSDAASSPSAPAATATPDPDVVLAAAVLRREQAMLDRVVATLRTHPTLGVSLRETREAHQAHVRLLAGAVPHTGLASPSDSPSASSSAGTSAGARPHRRPVAVPPHPGAALTALAGAEQRLTHAERGDSLDARSGPFARVLAGMAASAAQRTVHLTAMAKEQPR